MHSFTTESARIDYPPPMSAPVFIYVAPARYEDILKLGFSHDPADRVRSFHARWFEYFDLERGFVLQATDEKDARRIELRLAGEFAEHRTQAPLVVERAVGGFTEWYRGAYPALRASAERLVATEGYCALEPLASRLHDKLIAEREQLFERTTAMLDAIDALGADPLAVGLRRSLRDALDAYAALGVEVDEWLPEDVRAWRTQ